MALNGKYVSEYTLLPLERMQISRVEFIAEMRKRGIGVGIHYPALHLFSVPFYYIEYAIAQLGALQVWANWRKDGKRALTDYKNALKLGGSRPLPELFRAAGTRFDFSRKTLAPLVAQVREELAGIRPRCRRP